MINLILNSFSLSHSRSHTLTHSQRCEFSKTFPPDRNFPFSSVFSVCKSSRRMQKIKNDWFQIVQIWPYNSIQTDDDNNRLPCWCIRIHVVLIHDRETREQNKAQSWFQHFCINNNNKICYVLSETYSCIIIEAGEDQIIVVYAVLSKKIKINTF